MEPLTIEELKAEKATLTAKGRTHASKPGEWSDEDTQTLEDFHEQARVYDRRIAFLERYPAPE